MAELHSTAQDLSLTVRPFRVVDDGPIVWYSLEVILHRADKSLGYAQVSMTGYDLADLNEEVTRISGDEAGARTFISDTDDDLVIVLEVVNDYGLIAFGHWTGEPGALMAGYRFFVQADELLRFGTSLLGEAQALQRGNRR